MSLQFSKMQALGNDFLIIDGISQTIAIEKLAITRLAHRQLGIGFDQLLLLEKGKNADFFCRIFNADSSEVEQCGNGLRCLAKWLLDKKFTEKSAFFIETVAGIFHVKQEDGLIEINMGMPIFEPARIPFAATKMKSLYQISLEGSEEKLTCAVLSMGNPHAIIKVPSIEYAPVFEIGSKLNEHPDFPKGVNVGFLEVVSPEHVRLRTFERGVGETYACGSNASAAAVAGILHYSLKNTVKLELLLGSLTVTWMGGNGDSVFLKGPAEWVFEGTLSRDQIAG